MKLRIRVHTDEPQERGFGIGYYIGSFIGQIVFSLLANIIVSWFSRRREFKAEVMAENLARNAIESTPVPLKLNPRRIGHAELVEVFRDLLES